jgi:HEAT repeat protein
MVVNKDTSTEDLIWALENAQYRPQRRYAAEILGERGATEATPNLLNALKDPEEIVQNDAAEALANIAGEDVVEPLIENLGDSRASVRKYSAYVLGQLAKKHEGNRHIRDIIAALENQTKDENDLVRRDVFYALSEIGATSSKHAFIDGLNDSDSAVRRYSADVLGKIKGREAEEALSEAFRTESDQNTRQTIASALTGFKTKSALFVIIERLPDEAEPVRVSFARKLADVGTPLAISTLSNLALSDTSPRVRTTAMESLAAKKDPTMLPVFAKALKDRVPAVRIPASAAMIGLADESVVEILIDAMRDSNQTVAGNAARALAKMEDLSLVPEMVKLLYDPSPAVVNRAMVVLGDLTFKPYGSDAQMWKNWYKKNYKTVEHKPVEQ